MPRPLDALLRPRSVAVIGASNKRASLGGMVTRRLFEAGFTGRIYPVNPRQHAVHSTTAYAALADLPDRVDLALVVVPRDHVLPAAEECCRLGVPAVAIISSGFKEADEEGRRLEEQLTALLREHGVRFIGPNCMGLFNTHSEVRLDATFSPTPPLAGPVGFASQSGALGVVVLNLAQDRRLGFSQFVSLGNKSDVSENDVLEAWADDPEVPVITTYLESFADAPRFLELAREVSRKKPVVLLKAGRTAAGARAASSHTGALAGTDTGTDALCRQAGVIRATSVDDMLDISLVLSRCPLPAGGRVAVLTNAGGPGIMAVDEACRLGLEMAELGGGTRRSLSERLPPQASVANPVDILPSASPDDFAACLADLVADDGVDAVVTITVTPPLFSPLDTLRAMSEVTRDAGKPVVTVFMVAGEFFGQLEGLEAPPPIFRAPEPAVRALAAALDHARARERAAEQVADPAMDHRAIDALLDEQVGRGGGYLGAGATFRVLEQAGLPVVAWREVASREEALAAAGEIGYPVVLKATGERLVHKSDLGAVALDLPDAAALERALARIEGALTGAGHAAGSWSWLIQGMSRGGREVIVGASRDDQFGPLVMFGLGGKYVEVLRDVGFALAAMTPGDAERLVRGLRGLALLTGTRGEEGVDLAAAVDAVLRVAALVRHHPQIVELDVNPLLLFPARERATLVDARIRV